MGVNVYLRTYKYVTTNSRTKTKNNGFPEYPILPDIEASALTYFLIYDREALYLSVPKQRKEKKKSIFSMLANFIALKFDATSCLKMTNSNCRNAVLTKIEQRLFHTAKFFKQLVGNNFSRISSRILTRNSSHWKHRMEIPDGNYVIQLLSLWVNLWRFKVNYDHCNSKSCWECFWRSPHLPICPSYLPTPPTLIGVL